MTPEQRARLEDEMVLARQIGSRAVSLCEPSDIKAALAKIDEQQAHIDALEADIKALEVAFNLRDAALDDRAIREVTAQWIDAQLPPRTTHKGGGMRTEPKGCAMPGCCSAVDTIAALQRENAALREALVELRRAMSAEPVLPFDEWMISRIDAALTPTKEEARG